MKILLHYALLLISTQCAAPIHASAAKAPTITPDVSPEIAMAKPAYKHWVKDPAFGTPFIRVTNPGNPQLLDLGCGSRYCTHRYSSAQAWNADQSLLLIENGCHGFCFLNGQTYEPLFVRQSEDECEWHPHDPTLMICLASRGLYAWHPLFDTRTTIDAFQGYHSFEFGPYKGNLSNDGSRIVVRATNTHGDLVAFAYDIQARKKFPEIALGSLQGRNGFCSISPSGRYVLCVQDMPEATNQTYVFTVDGTQIQHWAENHRPGHGDMTIDADGSDVYVGISKSDPDKYHIIKRRLQDGAVTDLAPYGEAVHASMRNTNRSGWVFVTYTGTYNEVAAHPNWAPFYDEVIALRIDGSGKYRRIVHTHDVKSDYWSEVHASPSPDGSQVIWSSNWERTGGPVADFVARLSWTEERVPEANADGHRGLEVEPK